MVKIFGCARPFITCFMAGAAAPAPIPELSGAPGSTLKRLCTATRNFIKARDRKIVSLTQDRPPYACDFGVLHRGTCNRSAGMIVRIVA